MICRQLPMYFIENKVATTQKLHFADFCIRSPRPKEDFFSRDSVHPALSHFMPFRMMSLPPLRLARPAPIPSHMMSRYRTIAPLPRAFCLHASGSTEVSCKLLLLCANADRPHCVE